MSSFQRVPVLLTCAGIAFGTASVWAQLSPMPPPGFTAAQADAGKALFMQKCAVCHGNTLDNGSAPPLAGPGGARSWFSGTRSLHQMFATIHERMPPGAGGSISEKESLDVVAFILQRNSFATGPTDLTVAALDVSPKLAGRELAAGGPPLPQKPGFITRSHRAFKRWTQSSNEAHSDWQSHSYDAHSSRYSPLTGITPKNAAKLAPQWYFELPDGVSMGSATPIVVNGTMYFNSGTQMFAVNAATGELRWRRKFDSKGGGDRGPVYGDGKIFAQAGTTLYAVDAASGELVKSFGSNGMLDVVKRALLSLDPVKFAKVGDPYEIGYTLVGAPNYFNGTLYIGVGSSARLITGGLLVAVDAGTGKVKWVFRTIPQGPQESGWEVSKDTWSGPERRGGGVWTTPAIDPDLGLVYFNAGDATPNYDGASRKGMNLFTNALLAVHMDTGKLAWYFQSIHHDMWDYDLSAGPTLFDAVVNGERVPAVASLGKTCYVYAFNRKTGAPLYPIVEMPVPTHTDIPGEEPWPTQPIPFTARSTPQSAFCATYPQIDDPELAKRARPAFYPYQSGELVIISPGLLGGANRGSPAFSERTQLLYITGKNDAVSYRAKSIGDMVLTPSPDTVGQNETKSEEGPTGMTRSQNIAAFDPATGDLAWVTKVPGTTNGGGLVTAGNVVFQAVGSLFYALDATNGKKLTEVRINPTSASPLAYRADGREFIAISSGSSVTALGID